MFSYINNSYEFLEPNFSISLIYMFLYSKAKTPFYWNSLAEKVKLKMQFQECKNAETNCLIKKATIIGGLKINNGCKQEIYTSSKSAITITRRGIRNRRKQNQVCFSKIRNLTYPWGKVELYHSHWLEKKKAHRLNLPLWGDELKVLYT